MQMTELKKLRIDNGLKACWVAKELNVSRQSLSAYENGRQAVPERYWQKLAVVYGVSTDMIMSMSGGRYAKYANAK